VGFFLAQDDMNLFNLAPICLPAKHLWQAIGGSCLASDAHNSAQLKVQKKFADMRKDS
jgi:hypothetical protein